MTERAVASSQAQSTEHSSVVRSPEYAPPGSSALRLQRSIGNRALGRFLQAKLRVGAPDDRYEHEADRVADLVMGLPHHGESEITAASGPLLQRCSCGGGCPSCAANEDSWVQRVAISPAPPDSLQRAATDMCSYKDEAATPEETKEEDAQEQVPGEDQVPAEEEERKAQETPVQPKRQSPVAALPDDIEERLNSTRGEGQPLPQATRHFMEYRFGHEFSHVRVHTGASAHRLNHDLNALAFTTGTHIYFGPGQFQPATRAGQHLLAHELTHVVQQGGGAGSGMVREKAGPSTISRRSKPETKWYYHHLVSGEYVHYRIERILRDNDEDRQLVTEAAIPGADRFSPALNKIGVADLYKSQPSRTVSGVKGFDPVESPRDIVAMNNPEAVGTQPAVTSSPTVSGKRDAAVRTWHGDFPQKIWLGEIKPLAASKVGAGLFQLDSYDQGYKAFVARIHQVSGGSTRASIDVGRLTFRLPTFLDFDNWATQHTLPDNRTTIKNRRLWAANIGNGLYVYFDLAKSATGPPPAWQTDQLRQMRELRADLGGGKHPRTDTMGPMVNGKFLPGGPELNARREAPQRKSRLIQRATKDRPDNYWPERGREWEEKRSKWGKGFRTTLKSSYKSYREKLQIEKKLGRTSRGAPAGEKAEVRDYKQLLFWSGLPGRFLGKVRFLMGTAWDKILGVFERMKEKMHVLRQKVGGTSEAGFLSTGWRKTLIKILVKAAKFVVVKFITESFNFFVECFHSAMDKVWAKIQGELTERFAEELCKARKFYDESKERLENEWGVSLKQIQELLELIQSAKHWVDIATGLIQAIRLGVQVISCLSPPALGCLWGLVAQFGIGTALDLLIGTQWFNDNIVSPTIGGLVRKYATPYYQRLINRALGENLKEYHCHIADENPKLGLAFNDGLKEGSSEIIAHRDNWQAQNQDAMLKDLQAVFEKGKGRAVSKAELLELAEYLKKSNKSPEELKKLLEGARDPLTGRLKFEAAQENVKAGELPQAPPGGEGEPKKRKIDYPKATKRNKQLQRSLGWDPVTFYKKPGVSADSEEFADAVYDTQEALHILADGILGEQTLLAFYDRNKLKPDAAYQAAVRVREDRKAARENAEREKAEKDKPKAKEGKASGDLVAIAVPKPPDGTTIRGDRFPDVLLSDPGWAGVPFGTTDPEFKEGETHAAGELVTLNVRFWIENQWVWFKGIPATFSYVSSFNGHRLLGAQTGEDFYFKLTPGASVVYYYRQGVHGMFLD
jgi:hypothetical protein